MNNSEYRFQLDRTSTKYICPKCEHKTFTRYIDTEGALVFPANVGRCDREDKCRYHYSPKDYFTENGILKDLEKAERRNYVRIQPKQPEKSISHIISPDIMENSIRADNNPNNFLCWFRETFGSDALDYVLSLYRIGTFNGCKKIRPADGATVFWQVDIQGNVRAGKVMQYDRQTGKRIKTGVGVSWIHSELNIPDYQLQQCFFGEHLLNDNSKDVCLVEAEKTAVIMSHIARNNIWIATGGASNTNMDLSPLTGRKVYLFPDNGKLEDWREFAGRISKVAADTYISPFMETEANVQEGDDIADVMLRMGRGA